MTTLVLAPWANGWSDWLAVSAAKSTGTRMWAADDDTLIAEVQRGSEGAFAVLVQRHQQALRAFLRRACGNRALADDLAQEAFLAAWSGIHKLKPGANLRAWLCGIGYRKALTALRSDRRSRRREEGYDPSGAIALSPSAEDRMSLESAMAQLPLDQRACVALCLGGDFTHAEAADALGMPLGTVKSHVQRGRARLLVALGVPDDAG